MNVGFPADHHPNHTASHILPKVHPGALTQVSFRKLRKTKFDSTRMDLKSTAVKLYDCGRAGKTVNVGFGGSKDENRG